MENSITQVEKCWKSIGVFGDSTCEKLERYGHCRHCPEYSKSGRKLLDREIPPGAIDEWTRIIATPKQAETQGSISVLVFRVMNEWVAIRTAFYQEAVEVRTIHTVPFRTDNTFLGLVNVNGELLLCASSTDLLGLGETGTDNESHKKSIKRMLVINKESDRYVLPVDEVQGVIRINEEDLQKAPATIFKSPSTLTTCIFNQNNINVGLIDEEKFFQHLKRSLSW